jgi:hypothetical protein
VLDALPYIESKGGWDGGGGGRLDRLAVIVNQASSVPIQEQHVVEEAFRRAGVSRRVVVPQDAQLGLMLDSATYAHDRLERATRLPLKEAALLVTQRLV